MPSRAAVALVLLALVLQPLLPVAAPPGEGEAWEESCTVWIVAVSSGGGGVLGNLTVTVRYPGEGRVYISTSPAAMVDTQGSARLAAFAASLLAGVDMSSLDFFYDIESDSIIVGGPSAGLAMALATYAILAGLPCPEGVAATGMIQADTTVGPVGGLKEKLEAAAAGGAGLFIIPAGQEVYTYYERVERRVGPITWTELRRVTVNLTELGAELGVRVVQAATLADAVEAVWGEAPTAERAPGVPGWIAGLLDGYARATAEKASRIAGPLEGYGGMVSDLAREALNSSARAVEYADAGHPYMAALEAIDALYSALAANITASALESRLDVTWAVRAVNETIVGLWEALEEGRGSGSIAELESLAYAYAKLYVAAFYYKKALEALDESGGSYRLPATLLGVNPAGALLLARAWSMADWAWFWLNASLEAPPGPGVDPLEARRAAGLLAAQARTAVAYLDALLAEAGRMGGETLALALELAEEAAAAARPEAAVGLAAESIALTTAVVHEVFTVDEAGTLEALLETARLAASRAPTGVHSRTLLSLAEATEGLQALQAASKAVVYAWVESKLAGLLECTPAPGPEGMLEVQTQPPPTPPATAGEDGQGANATTPPPGEATATPPPQASGGLALVAAVVAAAAAVGALVAAAEIGRRR